MVILPRLFSLLAGSTVKRICREHREISLKSREEARNLQIEKINLLLEHFGKMPFYRKLLQESGCLQGRISSLDDMASLPIMTKQIITENFDEISSKPEVNFTTSTSGSTGVNFKFCHSRYAQNSQRASLMLMYHWMGIDFFTDKKLTIWGLHPGASFLTNFSQSLKNKLKNTSLLQAYGLDEEKCSDFLSQIDKYDPKLITSYPGYAYDIAKFANQQSLMPPTALKAIVLSGEMIYDYQIEEIEKFFHCKVYRRYGSREFGNIAHECRYSRNVLHILPSCFYVENDQDGNLLITDLNNFATPFIRYNIGDMGRVDYAECECGFEHQSIIDIVGRSHDVIRTKSGKQLPGQFWTTLSRSVPGIERFQVVQVDEGNIEFRVMTTKSYLDSEEHKLHEELAKLAGDEMSMKVSKVSEIELTPSGKHKYVIKL